MKRSLPFLMSGLCLLGVSIMTASGSDESDRAALREIKTAYETAVNEGNPSKLAPYLSDTVTAVMVTNEEVSGLAGLESYWSKIQGLIGHNGTYRVKVQVDKTDLFGDLAVSRGTTEEVVHLGNGQEFRYSAHWTTICRRENGTWKLLRMHSSIDPIQNEFVQASKTAGQWLWGGIGLIAGAVVSGTAVWILKKARR